VAKTRPYNQDCPIARTLDVVGDRWTLLIIRDLFLGKSRFSEFRESSPGIPPRLLSSRLKRLEEHGLIDRLVYSQYPLRAEYRLTSKGRSFFPVLYAMGSWGVSHLFDGEPELRESVTQFIESNVPEYRQLAAASKANERGS
jgi:DNA-binding HxlR family transcriptional regulator